MPLFSAPEIFIPDAYGTKNRHRKLVPENGLMEPIHDAGFWRVCHASGASNFDLFFDNYSQPIFFYHSGHSNQTLTESTKLPGRLNRNEQYPDKPLLSLSSV